MSVLMRSHDLTRARIRHGKVINLFQENVVYQEGLCHERLISVNSQLGSCKTQHQHSFAYYSDYIRRKTTNNTSSVS